MESPSKNVILGIDPGSICTGYGIIWQQGNQQGHITHGCIRPKAKDMSQRLYEIYERLSAIIEEYKPDQVAIEKVFMAKNAQSALKLGQARSAALVAAAGFKRPVFEYSSREIKQAIVGYGAAQKAQIQQMTLTLLKLKTKAPQDAADALGVALCHASIYNFKKRISQQS